MLRQRFLGVPDEQPVRGGWGGDMGQWGGVRPAVSGAVHQRAGAAVVCPGPDYPDQDRGPGPDLIFPALARRLQHCALGYRFLCDC